MSSRHKVEIYKTRVDQWRFKVSYNGMVTVRSTEYYTTKNAAIRGFERHRKAVQTAVVVEDRR